LTLKPVLDLRSEPELGSASSSVKYRPRHVLVATHIEVHGVGVGEPEQLGDLVSVHEVVDINLATHVGTL